MTGRLRGGKSDTAAIRARYKVGVISPPGPGPSPRPHHPHVLNNGTHPLLWSAVAALLLLQLCMEHTAVGAVELLLLLRLLLLLLMLLLRK